MKTTAITVERGYRIDNQDQYMKAKLSQTVEPQEGEQMQTCALRAIEMLDTVFRLAYPFVDPILNFPNASRQVNNHICEFNDMVKNRIDLEEKEESMPSMEEMINSCTETTVLESYRLLAKSKPEWEQVYLSKKKELDTIEANSIIKAADYLLPKEGNNKIKTKI